MLTRLKVSGFKNLENVDVRFGPFTCIAGANGVGKSNLFDAITFLSALADKPLSEAAAAVRGTEGRVGDVRSLFRNSGDRRASEMSFEAEMIIPESGTDDLGSPATASMTFLRYRLVLRHRQELSSLGPLEIVSESMVHINKAGAAAALGFQASAGWRDSVIKGRRTVPYIDTEVVDGKALVLVRADSIGGAGGGGPRKALAATMPRTVLSTANNAGEHRTLVLARKEMMGWTQLQLEPTALRAPDPFNAPAKVGPNGAHLAAALYALARAEKRSGEGEMEDVYQRVANRLGELFENVRSLVVEEDTKRELLTIVLTDMQRTAHLASSLSDGTLRFLALAILEEHAMGPSVLCLEEPENGIHPDRIKAMIQLLRAIAVDTEHPVGPDNPMRQVIVNTHSPGVVNEVPHDTLVVAEAADISRGGQRTRILRLRGLVGTWRGDDEAATILPLISYLGLQRGPSASRAKTERAEKRLVDRADVRQLGLFSAASETVP
jgi:predicted ATPase